MATATATKATRKSKPKPPDVCRLSLTIRGTVYGVRPIPSEDGRAWRLRKADGTAHDVAETPHGATCTCGDQTWRHEGIDATGCKHIRALRALGLIVDAGRVEPVEVDPEDDPDDPDAVDPSTWPSWTDGHTYTVTR